MKTVVVGHEQIGADKETGTDPESFRIFPKRYDNHADFAPKLIVLTIVGRSRIFSKSGVPKINSGDFEIQG